MDFGLKSRYIIDFTMKLREITPAISIVYSPKPGVEVFCLRLNINISKLGKRREWTGIG